MASVTVPIKKPKKPGTMARKEATLFWICVAPWIIGFLLFDIGPMIYSLFLSFTRWTILTPPVWIGLQNYKDILTSDPEFIQSLKVTLQFAFFSIPTAPGNSSILGSVAQRSHKCCRIVSNIILYPCNHFECCCSSPMDFYLQSQIWTC